MLPVPQLLPDPSYFFIFSTPCPFFLFLNKQRQGNTCYSFLSLSISRTFPPVLYSIFNIARDSCVMFLLHGPSLLFLKSCQGLHLFV